MCESKCVALAASSERPAWVQSAAALVEERVGVCVCVCAQTCVCVRGIGCRASERWSALKCSVSSRLWLEGSAQRSSVPHSTVLWKTMKAPERMGEEMEKKRGGERKRKEGRGRKRKGEGEGEGESECVAPAELAAE